MAVSQAKKKGETVKRKVLKLSEDKNGSAYIKELREIQVGGWDLPFSGWVWRVRLNSVAYPGC
jgi:hypothetical protein